MCRVWVLCFQLSPFVASPAWEKCSWSQYGRVRAQVARRSPWYFGKGKQPLLQLGPESSNSRKQPSGTPREEGASPFPLVGPSPGRNGNQTRTVSMRKGRIRRTGLGTSWRLCLAVVGREEVGGWPGWLCLKRDFSSRLGEGPCPAQGLCYLPPAVCLGSLLGHMTRLLLPAPALSGLKPKVLVGRRM